MSVTVSDALGVTVKLVLGVGVWVLEYVGDSVAVAVLLYTGVFVSFGVQVIVPVGGTANKLLLMKINSSSGIFFDVKLMP